MKKAFGLILLVVMLTGFPVMTGSAQDGGVGESDNTGFTGSAPLEYTIALPVVMNDYAFPVEACIFTSSALPFCDMLDVTHTSESDGRKPIYSTQDEGFYNGLFLARQFTIGGYYYHVEAWNTIVNPTLPLNLDGYNHIEAFVYIYAFGNAYVLQLQGGMIDNDNITDY